MTKHKLTDIMSTSSPTEISRRHLNSFLNSSASEVKCSSKCQTINSSSSNSSSCKPTSFTTTNSSGCNSSSSSSDKHNAHKSRKHRSSKKSTNCKSKYNTSTYTTTNSSSGSCLSSSCPSSSCSNSCQSSSCSSSCPSNSSLSNSSSKFCSNSSSNSSCGPCKVNCSPYALKCNTYKSLSGTILIPGPQGQSSSSQANFSGIYNSSDNVSSIYINFPIVNYVNIIPSTTTNENDTFTFNLTGKYLFQYNIYIQELEPPNTICFSGTVNGIANSSFGNQNIPNAGSYGCSVIQDMLAGDVIFLKFTSVIIWNFASLTIIKL